ncbi:MAG: pyridoxamine 5'-phosphate oxidase family protein [Acidimicrobiales bacterium]
MSADLGPGPRTRVRRLPAKAAYDEATIYAIFDAAHFVHVAAIVDGQAIALPTLCAREGGALYLHGSPGNAVLRATLAAGRACVTATIYDGLRLARSGFESSVAYRSAVAFGRATSVDDDAERRRVLDLLVDAVLPGRAREVRAMTDAEVRLTLVVRVDVDEASAKVSAGPTDDDADDANLAVWAGLVPARVVFGEPEAFSTGAMARGAIPVPDSVRRLLDSS